MNRISKAIIFILFCSAVAKASLQPLFKHLKEQDGLTSSITKCIFKDHNGFLWVGTFNGLNRFDGKNIVTYQHKTNDTSSLINNDIMGICEDDLGRIWVATHSGLSVLDPSGKKFTNYTQIKTKSGDINFYSGVPSICFFKNKIWVGLLNGIASTPTDKINFELVSKEDLRFTGKTLRCVPNLIFPTKKGLWISTFAGMFFTEDGKTFFNKTYDPKNIPLLHKGYIAGFYNDGDSVAYFCNWHFSGIYKYNYASNKLDSIKTGDYHIINFMWLCKVSENKMWAATITGGIMNIDLKTGEFDLIKPGRYNSQSLSDEEVDQIFMDEQGTIFAATKRGLDYVNAFQTQFKIYRNDPDDAHSLPEYSSIDIAEDGNGIIWMGTMKNGLYSMDPATGYTEHFSFPGLYDHIWNIYYENGKLMLSTDGGLSYFDVKEKKLSPIKGLSPEVNNGLTGYLTFICKDKDENYWFGLWQSGILKYNFQTKKSIYFAQGDSLHPLTTASPMCGLIDKQNNLWFGALESTTVSCLNISDNKIFDIKLSMEKKGGNNGYAAGMELDDEGNIWVAASQGGIYKLDPKTKTFSNYNSENGLSNDQVTCILRDKKNNLWISTSNGLNKMDLKTNKISSYLLSDGLPSNQFSDNPCLLSNNGKLFFGCDLFMIKFDPDSLFEDPFSPVSKILSYDISGVKNYLSPDMMGFDLSYKDKIVSFEFSAVNFIDADKTQFAYMLDGFDKDWTYCGNRTFASYTNLPEGNYIFKVKASDHFKDWNVKECSLTIHVDGPFWKKWWFIALCIAGLTGIISLIYYQRLMQILKLQEIRNKISKDLHDEIGSSLSSISISSEVAKRMTEQKAPEASAILANIGESARTAMENMSDIVWAINPKNDRFSNILSRLQIFANQLFDVNNIDLHFEVPESLNEMKLSMQHRKNIYLILKEAVNNVAKYSEAKNCFVTIESSGKLINVEVKDDGKGFAENKQTLGGNGLINMKQRVSELNGIFNIFSEEKKGTTLSFQFES